MNIIGRILIDLRLRFVVCLFCLALFLLAGCQANATLEPIAINVTQTPLTTIALPLIPTVAPTPKTVPTTVSTKESVLLPSPTSLPPTTTLLPTLTPSVTNVPESSPATATPFSPSAETPTEQPPTASPTPTFPPPPTDTITPTETVPPTETPTSITPTITATITATITPTVELTPTATVIITPTTSAASCASISDISLEECDALATMARFWSADPHFWFENNQACSWYGIRCEDGHVVGIALIHDGLEVTTSGELNPELFSVSLPYLRELTLTGGFSGAIPAEIGRFTSLTTLAIFSPHLMGTIPPEIGNLINLRSLSLGGVSSRYGQQYACPCGNLPTEIGRLTQLNSLIINLSKLNGTLPSEIGNLTALTNLDLSWNDSMVGELPATVANLTQLQRLNYDHGCLYAADGDSGTAEWLARVDQTTESYCDIYHPPTVVPTATFTPTLEPTAEPTITPTTTAENFCASSSSLPLTECTALQMVMKEADSSFVQQGIRVSGRASVVQKVTSSIGQI